jgi:hypothetical protein
MPGQFDGRRLQPINANRLLVARLILEPDVDIVPGFEHLLGRLRETRLIAVQRRHSPLTRNEQNKR